MKTFELRILACNRVFYEGPCQMLIFPSFDGEMAIMAGHEKMSTVIEVGEIRFKTEDGIWHPAIVSDGLLKVEKNKVKLLVYSAERPEEIDAFRAEADLERAREQLSQKQSIVEYHITRANLARAMARLQGANKHIADI
ncbi:MAG: ATP synthase F1 subunit epsilon [Lachnospiraceae bacterium]|nr:ATP synthase F1 subunit epsilon [Lachnospiraceae bacterium]